MTVRELIEELLAYPDNYVVLDDDGFEITECASEKNREVSLYAYVN